MVRWLLFASLAVTAWAQTTSPVSAEAESRLRERIGKFYSLLVEGRTSTKAYRQAEELVAEDSKDSYYVAKKPDLSEFHIASIEFTDGGQKAKVVVRAKARIMMIGAGLQEFEIPVKSTWKLENGEWMFYMDPVSLSETPFGTMHPGTSGTSPDLASMQAAQPSVASLRTKVKIDRTAVVLTPNAPVQTVTISNELPGPIDITMDDLSRNIPGLTVSIGATHVEGGKTTEVKMEARPGAAIASTVHLFAAPLNIQFDVQVRTQ
ncbi:MAG: hypothetical protein ABSB15_02665 [Bryobacteraceae bacterium]